MRIGLSSIMVNDQSHALEFYTNVLGFELREDVPTGEYRYLTVAERDAPGGAELLLEPNAHEAAKVFQEAIYDDGIPATMFFVEDMDAEIARLKEHGVEFKGDPVDVGTAIIAVFDDTCGNFIQICEVK